MVATVTHPPLWPGKRLKVIGVTGRYNSGKTQFLLSMADCARTRMYDMEMSSSHCEDYEEEGLQRIDMPFAMQQAHPNGYSAKDLFLWWYKDVKAIPVGSLDAICLDPGNELESGMIDWVKSRYAEWGFHSATGFAKMEGVFWGTVKEEWKRVLVEIATKCQTLGFSNHLRTVWESGKPTDKVEPKGKATWMELSSLYLFLERNVLGTDERRNFAQPPSAIVLKSRLSRRVFKDGRVDRIIPILPDRIPIATPNAIREYLLNPAGLREARDDEKVQEKHRTDDEILGLKAQIAENERVTAEVNRENIKEAKDVATQQEASRAAAYATLKPDHDNRSEASSEAEPESAPAAVDNVQLVKAMLALATKKNVKERVVKAIQSEIGVPVDGRLTKGQAKLISADLVTKYTDGLAKV